MTPVLLAGDALDGPPDLDDVAGPVGVQARDDGLAVHVQGHRPAAAGDDGAGQLGRDVTLQGCSHDQQGGLDLADVLADAGPVGVAVIDAEFQSAHPAVLSLPAWLSHH